MQKRIENSATVRKQQRHLQTKRRREISDPTPVASPDVVQTVLDAICSDSGAAKFKALRGLRDILGSSNPPLEVRILLFLVCAYHIQVIVTPGVIGALSEFVQSFNAEAQLEALWCLTSTYSLLWDRDVNLTRYRCGRYRIRSPRSSACSLRDHAAVIWQPGVLHRPVGAC